MSFDGFVVSIDGRLNSHDLSLRIQASLEFANMDDISCARRVTFIHREVRWLAKEGLVEGRYSLTFAARPSPDQAVTLPAAP